MAQLKIAAIQTTSGDDIAANIAQLEPLLREASALGARFIATPENTFYMRREGTASMDDLPMHAHAGIMFAQRIAKELGVWLLIGSIRAREDGAEKAYNRSVLIAPDGEVTASYDKIHLFDVVLSETQRYLESAQAQAGAQAVVAPLMDFTLGLSICYDLRFPALYQALAARGADVLAVPSAFTRPTGAAHWHTLLRARAIENACYVIAPAQCGSHPGGRETYGHSLIVNPWGEIIAEAQTDIPQVIVATFDSELLHSVRQKIPVLAHRRQIV